jgi:hypothetical protein
MRYLFGFLCVCALGVVPVVGCGDDAATLAPELFGTWVSTYTELNGMRSDDCLTDCATVTFNADGTYVVVVPILPERGEGTWSTRGSILTLTHTKAGPDVDNLQPIDPPRTTTMRWSVSGDTLATSVPGTTFYWRKESTHEDAGLAELRGS